MILTLASRVSVFATMDPTLYMHSRQIKCSSLDMHILFHFLTITDGDHLL